MTEISSDNALATLVQRYDEYDRRLRNAWEYIMNVERVLMDEIKELKTKTCKCVCANKVLTPTDRSVRQAKTVIDTANPSQTNAPGQNSRERPDQLTGRDLTGSGSQVTANPRPLTTNGSPSHMIQIDDTESDSDIPCAQRSPVKRNITASTNTGTESITRTPNSTPLSSGQMQSMTSSTQTSPAVTQPTMSAIDNSSTLLLCLAIGILLLATTSDSAGDSSNGKDRQRGRLPQIIGYHPTHPQASLIPHNLTMHLFLALRRRSPLRCMLKTLSGALVINLKILRRRFAAIVEVKEYVSCRPESLRIADVMTSSAFASQSLSGRLIMSWATGCGQMMIYVDGGGPSKDFEREADTTTDSGRGSIVKEMIETGTMMIIMTITVTGMETTDTKTKIGEGKETIIRD